MKSGERQAIKHGVIRDQVAVYEQQVCVGRDALHAFREVNSIINNCFSAGLIPILFCLLHHAYSSYYGSKLHAYNIFKNLRYTQCVVSSGSISSEEEKKNSIIELCIGLYWQYNLLFCLGCVIIYFL